MTDQNATGIAAIRRIAPEGVAAFVPPLSGYKDPSTGWSEAEYRILDIPVGRAAVGYWTGQPGSVAFDAWPYTEVCSILSGNVGVRDAEGATLEFRPGEGFVIPKGWRGTWLTLTTATKIFIALD